MCLWRFPRNIVSTVTGAVIVLMSASSAFSDPFGDNKFSSSDPGNTMTKPRRISPPKNLDKIDKTKQLEEKAILRRLMIEDSTTPTSLERSDTQTESLNLYQAFQQAGYRPLKVTKNLQLGINEKKCFSNASKQKLFATSACAPYAATLDQKVVAK